MISLRSAALVAAVLSITACSTRARAEVGADVGIDPAVVVAESSASERVWVCHRGRWLEVAAPALEAHVRHGDSVGRLPRETSASC